MGSGHQDLGVRRIALDVLLFFCAIQPSAG
jgi:hypothetical protein